MSNFKSFKPKYTESQTKTGAALKIIPLGGVGDVTKNMYVYECGQDIIIVDCGIGFPDEAMLGIDLIIPDTTYLKDKVNRIKGIVISHGHDDHIGGLPYLWPQLKCPIYAQKLATGFIKNKFTEYRLPKEVIKEVNVDSRLQLGAFNISFYQVSHSVPDSVGIVIDTPAGKIIHQADFKLDWTPVSGQVTEVGKLAIEGEKGVLLMLIDGLRVAREGYSRSESTVGPTLKEISTNVAGKILITTTSSNISRIQQAIDVAAGLGRKVSFLGRSMDSNFQVAWDLGYLNVPNHLVIPADEIKRFPDNQLMLIVAGAQGQPDSSLSRIANNDHKFATVKPKDVVIFSADPIPGSESAQSALINRLTKLGAKVHYTALNDELHVSGHAGAEEIKVMINLAQPKYVMPIGATFSQMKIFSEMAEKMGYTTDQVLLVEDGQVINASAGQIRIDGNVEVKNIYIDGLGIGDVGSVVLRDRQVMAEEGIVLVIVPVDSHTSQPAGDVDIVSRGFVFEKESGELLEKAKKVVENALLDHPNSILDWRFTRRHIEEKLEEYFYKQTQRRPLVLPVIVEV